MKSKMVLDTDMCKINLTEEGYQVLILSEKSGWIEHHPFPNELIGLVNALDTAMNVVSGKIFIRGIAKTKAEPVAIESKRTK